MKDRIVGWFLAFVLAGTPLAAVSTHAIRAAIDIGMGGPKLQIAEVDLETNKIVKTVHTQRYFVNFYESVAQSHDNRLGSEVRKQGLSAFKEAVETANSFGVDGVVAIATESFRAAADGLDFAEALQAETGVKVHIINQQLEGELVFEAVLTKMDVAAENLVVWDIGGGSIQFIESREGSYFVDCGKEGVGAFKDFIIEKLQHRDTSAHKSPNPMSGGDIVQGELYAMHLSSLVDKRLRDKIRDASTTIVGAGSVFAYGIAPMVGNKSPFTVDDLAPVISSLVGKTDADLGGGEFAFCEGSNAVFTMGAMWGLGIKKMHIVNVNNADGALFYKPFWE